MKNIYMILLILNTESPQLLNGVENIQLRKHIGAGEKFNRHYVTGHVQGSCFPSLMGGRVLRSVCRSAARTWDFTGFSRKSFTFGSCFSISSVERSMLRLEPITMGIFKVSPS